MSVLGAILLLLWLLPAILFVALLIADSIKRRLRAAHEHTVIEPRAKVN